LEGVEAALLLDSLYVVAGVVGGSDASAALCIPDAVDRSQYAVNLQMNQGHLVCLLCCHKDLNLGFEESTPKIVANTSTANCWDCALGGTCII
jgi:hypothetical protein